MHHAHPRSNVAPAFALTLLTAALLAACGGGGDGEDPATGIDDATATAYSANATEMASDAASVADSAILATQVMVAAGAGVGASDDQVTAQSASVQPQLASTRACPGGGSATVSITGGTAASEANGKLDTGEIYQVSYAACAGAGGVGRLDGSLAITVLNATGDSVDGALSLSTTATNLMLTTTRGSASLNGSTQRDFSVATHGATVQLTSRFVAPGVTLATSYNARSSTFTLSNTDIQRTATLSGGVLQSSTINGMHTLSATLPNGAFSFSVATIGGASYGADGLPTSGSWAVTLPQNLVTTTVANALATITVDHGKDGTIDRTFTIPVAQLARSAG